MIGSRVSEHSSSGSGIDSFTAIVSGTLNLLFLGCLLLVLLHTITWVMGSFATGGARATGGQYRARWGFSGALLALAVLESQFDCILVL